MPDVWTSRPASNRHAVAFCVDRAAYPVGEALGRLIKESEPTLDVLLCLEAVDDTLPRLVKDSPLRYVALGGKNRFERLPTTRTITRSAYARLLLPQELDGDYERILYLDTDTLPIGGALSNLMTASMNDAAVAAASDLSALLSPPPKLRESYRNSGVLLLDCREGRAAEAFERVISYAVANADKLPQHDQSALNAALAGKMALLSPRWNFFHVPQMLPHQSSVDPVIFHFIGHDKPWVETGNSARMQYYETFRRMLDALFTPEDLAAYGLWGTASGGSRKYRNSLIERISRWNRRRNLRRHERNKPTAAPVSSEAMARFLAEADIP